MKFSFVFCGLLAIAVSATHAAVQVPPHQNLRDAERVLVGFPALKADSKFAKPQVTPQKAKTMVCSSDPGGACASSCNCASGPFICGGSIQGQCGQLCHCQ